MDQILQRQMTHLQTTATLPRDLLNCNYFKLLLLIQTTILSFFFL